MLVSVCLFCVVFVICFVDLVRYFGRCRQFGEASSISVFEGDMGHQYWFIAGRSCSSIFLGVPS